MVQTETRVTNAPRALDGIRVLDFTWVRAGPWGTRWLGALGAQIIKVEWPQNPDPLRNLGGGTTPPGVEINLNTSGQFNDTNANKFSITVNTRTEKGLDLIKRMISISDVVIEYLGSGVERAQAANERRRLQEKLKRTKYQFREGDIDQREYEQEMALTNAALEATEPHADDHVIQQGDHIEGLVEAWAMATKEERHQLLTLMLDAVYVDMKSAEVVGVKPKPEFLPLFNLKEPVRSGKTVLVTSGMDQSGSLP